MSIDYNFQPKGLKADLGCYDRGYIPHFDGGSIPQFLTFRLFDSVPRSVIEKLSEAVKEDGEEGQIRYRKSLERYMDNGFGACFLKDPDIAVMVENSLKYHSERKYYLSAWVIMPNHIHFLVTPFEGVELRDIAHSIKSYTAHEANKILDRSGQFWQHEPFDRYIRNRPHFSSVIRYIENNPVKAGLCARPEDGPYSSAALRLGPFNS